MNKNLFTLQRQHHNTLRTSAHLVYDQAHTDFWTIKRNESLMSTKPRANVRKQGFESGSPAPGGEKQLKMNCNTKYKDLY